MHWRVGYRLPAHKSGPGRPGLASTNQNLYHARGAVRVTCTAVVVFGLKVCIMACEVCTWEVREKSCVGVEAVFLQPLLCVLDGRGGTQLLLLLLLRTETQRMSTHGQKHVFKILYILIQVKWCIKLLLYILIFMFWSNITSLAVMYLQELSQVEFL